MHTFKEVQLDYEIQVSPATMPPQITLYVAVSFVCASLPLAVHPHVTIGAWKVRGRLWYSWISTLLREDSFYHEYYDVQLGPYGETNFRIYQRHFRSHIEYVRERLDHSSRLETLPRTEDIHTTWNSNYYKARGKLQSVKWYSGYAKDRSRHGHVRSLSLRPLVVESAGEQRKV